MSTGIYASVSRMPFPTEAIRALFPAFEQVLKFKQQQGRMGTILDEDYAKLDDELVLSFPSHGPTRRKEATQGSTWLLECRKSHGFHYHTFDVADSMLSARRLIFFADMGFTLEFFSYCAELRAPTGPLERFEVQGSSLTELAFDGRIVHRFRPTSGRLFAISFHSRDIDSSAHAAATQTYPVEVASFSDVVCHALPVVE